MLKEEQSSHPKQRKINNRVNHIDSNFTSKNTHISRQVDINSFFNEKCGNRDSTSKVKSRFAILNKEQKAIREVQKNITTLLSQHSQYPLS